MALKGNRNIIDTDISFTLSDVAAPGVGLVYSTAGSGIALGDSAGAVSLSASPSGSTFAGILLTNVVDIDETRYHRNFMKDEVTTGDKVTVLKMGWVITDKISGTPTVGNKAYLTTNGNFTPTVSSTGGIVATPYAGRFESGKDEDGYARISVNLPASI